MKLRTRQSRAKCVCCSEEKSTFIDVREDICEECGMEGFGKAVEQAAERDVSILGAAVPAVPGGGWALPGRRVTHDMLEAMAAATIMARMIEEGKKA